MVSDLQLKCIWFTFAFKTIIMPEVLLFIFFVLICVLYGVVRTHKQVDNILPVCVGSVSEYEYTILPKPSKVFRLPNGRYANTHSYHRIRIIGEGMGFRNNEEWLVDKITRHDAKTLMNGEKLLIYSKVSGVYEIICAEDFNDESNSSILGVVRYKILADVVTNS